MRPVWRGIRFRVTAVSVGVLTLILVVGGVVLVALQRSSLTTTIDQALIQRADDLTALVAGADFDGSFPAGAGDGFAQLIASDGSVLASTTNLSGADPLPVGFPGGDADRIRIVSSIGGDDDSFRVLSRLVGDDAVLHVGTEFEVVTEAAESLIALLAVTLPLLILASAGLTWWMVGTTLTPVEQIRAEVAEIKPNELQRRVHEPGTGDEIDRLAVTMNEMLTLLETASERQKRFVADASHELRSPLTRIRTALELETVTGKPAPAGEDEDLLQDVVDMQRLVEDLLYLARADEGVAEPLLQELDLDDLVISEAQKIRAEGRVEIDVGGVSGAHVNADPAQLRRAVRNLLENSQRHANKQVSVVLTEHAGEAVLTIADDGPGIPESDSERIFDRFTRLDDSRSLETGGSGLGLAIARDIVHGHGGSLRLASSEPVGAVFELKLRLAK